MPEAVDRFLVAEALDADPLKLRLELRHALLPRSHLSAELLHLPAELLQPRRLGVEQAEHTLERPAPDGGCGGRAGRYGVGRPGSHGHGRRVEQRSERRRLDDADGDGAGEVLTNARDALGGRVRKYDADIAVAAADRGCADPGELLAADAHGGFAVDHESLVVEVRELPAPRGLDRRAALVARLDALLVVIHRLALEILVHNRPPDLRIRAVIGFGSAGVYFSELHT